MNRSFRGGNIGQNEIQTAAENGGDHLEPPLQKLSRKRRHGFSSALKIEMMDRKKIKNYAIVCQVVK